MCKIKDKLKAFNDFKSKQKICNEVMLFDIKVYIFWKFIQCTIRWDKTEMLNEFPTVKINVTKNALFFLQAPINHSFTFISH